MAKIAVLGYGTIGSGVVEVIEKNQAVIAARAGEAVEVKSVLDIRPFDGDPIQPRIVHDHMAIANDPEITVVVETMGGVEPTFSFVSAMLEAGKSVCTSNKALIAAKGAELFALAKQKNVSFLYEASVGGGIPIIRTIHDALTAEVIEEISGILNGTTNYMLTRMSAEGSDYDAVLADAQGKGYAEKDPTADVGGFDACRKIAILTSLVSGKTVNFEEIHTEGITEITPADIAYAKALGRAVKLVASSFRTGGSYCCIVAPCLVPKDHPLYLVNDVMNAVFVKGNMLGDSMYYGAGAGKLMTASAVVGDVIDIIQHKDAPRRMPWSAEKLALAPYGDLENSFLVRTAASKEEVEEIFGQVPFIKAEGVSGELGFLTPKMSEKEFAVKAAKLGIIGRIRMK